MEGKDVRRRLIQSTLFPCVESSVKEVVEDCDANREEEVEEEEDEEWCGSSKKRGGSKRKGNSKPKKTPPASVKKNKVIENGKETSSKQVDDSESPVIVKSNFFVKASERRQQKKQNQLISIGSPEENNEICSTPPSVANGKSTPRKLKRQDNSTSRKEKRNSTPNKKMKSGNRESCCVQIPFDLTVDEQPLPKIPDLRLEAKLTAEENSRMFAGRQIHPFFTSRKGEKSSQELTDSESKWSSFERKEKGIAFKLIHVFENVEGDYTTLDWGQWVFSERSASRNLEFKPSPVCEGSVGSLNFDNFLSATHSTRTSLYQNSQQCSVPKKDVSVRLLDISECSHHLSSLVFDDVRETCIEQQKDSDMLPKNTEDLIAGSVESMLQDHKLEKTDFFDGIPCGGSMESEPQDRLLQERIMTHYYTCQNQPENCLWTDKYQPQNAKQICGNGESVKYLSEWLHLWHKRGSLTTRGCVDQDNSIVQDIDHDYQQSDSDTDNGEESLKNVLLVTGPVGSGKSAAIYTCARDQGFQIIEINASDWRNGALVKQKFGEAVESHWLQRTVENATNSDIKLLSKFFKTVNAEARCSDDEVIEVAHLRDEEDSQDAGSWSKISVSGYNRAANCQDGIKTLMLFEDVDATLYEDHGFISTIQQLAQTAKRPIILTSNSDNPVLPKSLDRFELSFSVPSVEDLLGLVHMICAAEKAKIHPCLVERFVDYCQGDIRKTITLLQFWFQGQTLGAGNELRTTYWPVLFDLDAGHATLPKFVEWGYPSQLSELVAEEVDKSLTLMEESHGLMDTDRVEDFNDYNTENIHMQGAEPDPIKVKKKAMLSLQSSLLDDVECVRFEANNELADFSCSPVAFARQSRQRKINTVLSSDSEDEFSCRSIPIVSAGGDINTEVLVMESQLLLAEIDQLPTVPIVVGRLEEDCYHLEERLDCSHIEDTCQSLNISFVPESSFVPETEVINEADLYSTTVSYGHLGNAVGANSVFQDQDSIPAVDVQSTVSFHLSQKEQERLGHNSDTSTPCVYEEEVGDSLSKSLADVPKGYQLLDECSRVDFMRRFKSLDEPEAYQVTDFVKESWKRLHDQCSDLRKNVTAEEKTVGQALILTHGMSNLISEADLLLKDCQTLASDSLASSAVPSERVHSFSYDDNQLEMSSILAQHGMCFYVKEIASLGSSIAGSTNTLDLASEMLSSSASSITLGKLACQDQRKVDESNTKTAQSFNPSTNKSDSSLCNILQSIVPSRSYLAAKGNAFHEYISTLSQISRYEASRLSGCMGNTRKQRRLRVPRHYLSSGSLAMSSEEISLLGQYNSYQKSSLTS